MSKGTVILQGDVRNLTGIGEQVPADAPLSSEALQAMLRAGPPGTVRGSRPEMPEMPEPDDNTDLPFTEEFTDSSTEEPSPEFEMGVTENEIPKEMSEKEIRESCILPPKEKQDQLKQKYGELRVVPIPFSAGEKKQLKAFIIRPLSGMAWRKFEEIAAKSAEQKPGVSFDEIFQMKVVSNAIVWPATSEQQLSMQRAGLVSTLFGVVQIISWFFNPESLMRATFVL